MTIRDLVAAYILADVSIASIIGMRLNPDMLRQKEQYPAGVITLIDVVRPPSLRTVAGLATARLQVDFYSDGNGAVTAGFAGSRAVVDWLGVALRSRLDGFGWVVGKDARLIDPGSGSPAVSVPVRAWIRFEQETAGPEPEIGGGLSRYSADYLVDYQTHDGRY